MFATMVYISLIIVLFQQNGIVHCQDGDDSLVDNDINSGNEIPTDNDNLPDDFNTFNFPSYHAPDEVPLALKRLVNGITHLWSTLSSTYVVDHGWLSSSEYYMKFHPSIKNLLRGKLIIGSLDKLNRILNVILSFHDMNDNILRDDDGQLLEYTSTFHDLGHLIEFMHGKYDYSFAKLRVRLGSNGYFNLEKTYFHFSSSSSLPLSSTTPDPLSTGITGPDEVSIDFTNQLYNAGKRCPPRSSCTWMLDTLNVGSGTTIPLKFRPDQIGNHTLSYVQNFGNSYKPLAAHSIHVKPNLETAAILCPNKTTIVGLYQTIAGGNGEISEAGDDAGNYREKRPPKDAFDDNVDTRYKSYGNCSRNDNHIYCGINTGLHFTVSLCPSLLVAIQFRTGERSEDRDPLNITIEGSNQISSDLLQGESWTLIYNGSTGLQDTTDRKADGAIQMISDNDKWFKSYRILSTNKRAASDSVDYADVILYGYYY